MLMEKRVLGNGVSGGVVPRVWICDCGGGKLGSVLLGRCETMQKGQTCVPNPKAPCDDQLSDAPWLALTQPAPPPRPTSHLYILPVPTVVWPYPIFTGAERAVARAWPNPTSAGDLLNPYLSHGSGVGLPCSSAPRAGQGWLE